jgi:hypothetical protein
MVIGPDYERKQFYQQQQQQQQQGGTAREGSYIPLNEKHYTIHDHGPTADRYYGQRL